MQQIYHIFVTKIFPYFLSISWGEFRVFLSQKYLISHTIQKIKIADKLYEQILSREHLIRDKFTVKK